MNIKIPLPAQEPHSNTEINTLQLINRFKNYIKRDLRKNNPRGIQDVRKVFVVLSFHSLLISLAQNITH